MIRISFKSAAGHYALLTITDNGAYAPDIGKTVASSSPGMSVIHGLAGQLEGALISHEEEGGRTISVQFPVRTTLEEP